MNDDDIEIPHDTARSRLAPRTRPSPPSTDDPDDVATVDERLNAFWEDYPNGRIATDVERTVDLLGVPTYQATAAVWVERTETHPATTAHATRTAGVGDQFSADSPLETAETVALGRALRYLGYTRESIRDR